MQPINEADLARVIMAIACPMLSAVGIGIFFFNRWKKRDVAVRDREKQSGKRERL